MSAHSHPKPPPEKHTVSIWTGVLGSPIVWSAYFGVSYAYVPWICKHGGVYIMHVSAAVCLALIALFFFICLWNFRKSEGKDEISEAGPKGRIIFASALGMMLSAMFFVLTFAQGIAPFMIDPCWQ